MWLSEYEHRALEYVFLNSTLMDSPILPGSPVSLLKLAVEFFVSYLKYLLHMLHLTIVEGYAEHRYQTSSIMQGIWSK